MRIYRPTRVASRSVPLNPDSTHRELPNEPRRPGSDGGQAMNAAPDVVIHTSLARSNPSPLGIEGQQMLQSFRCALAHVEGALEGIDACAVPLDQKVQAYKDQCSALAQCINMQQESWPEFADNADAQEALGQTLARLEAGTVALAGVPQHSAPALDDTHVSTADTSATATPRKVLARAAYMAGFKEVSRLAAQTRGNVLVAQELVDFLCVAADAFIACTEGDLPCENELNELLKLREALAACKLDFALLAPRRASALRNALQLLGLPAITKRPLLRILPTLDELVE